jgi:hypothetical protein
MKSETSLGQIPEELYEQQNLFEMAYDSNSNHTT